MVMPPPVTIQLKEFIVWASGFMIWCDLVCLLRTAMNPYRRNASQTESLIFKSVSDVLVLEMDWVTIVLKIVCIRSSWVVQELHYGLWLVCCFDMVLSTARFALGKDL